VLGKFKVNFEKRTIVKRVLRGLLGTTSGQVYESFTRWRSIPDRQDRALLAKGTRFEKNLMILFTSRLHHSFVPLKELHHDAQAFKRRAVLLLVKSQESDIKKALTRWNFLIAQLREQLKCRHAIMLT
jgi:hypothetical protein